MRFVRLKVIVLFALFFLSLPFCMLFVLLWPHGRPSLFTERQKRGYKRDHWWIS